jgi:SAM-dependent methyltransferase
MSTVQTDFDRIALVSPDGATQNEHYLNYLLHHLPAHPDRVLEIGCGKGQFSRLLAARAQHVLAIDLSPEMIRRARELSRSFANIEFRLADVMTYDLPAAGFDCIASIATLHHLPLRKIILKLKAALKPGGVLLILDLFAPQGLVDTILNPVAMAVSVTLRLIHQHRLLPSREVRAAWAAHEAHDIHSTMTEIHDLCADILPGAKIKKHLLWRYSIVWQKPT